MREQYHFKSGPDGFDVWDVAKARFRLVKDTPVEDLPLSSIADIDREYWFDHGVAPTVRNVVEHCRLIQEVDLSYPIVIDPDGRVMDGMHRVARALLEGAPKRSPRSGSQKAPDSRPPELSTGGGFRPRGGALSRLAPPHVNTA